MDLFTFLVFFVCDSYWRMIRDPLSNGRWMSIPSVVEKQPVCCTLMGKCQWWLCRCGKQCERVGVAWWASMGVVWVVWWRIVRTLWVVWANKCRGPMCVVWWTGQVWGNTVKVVWLQGVLGVTSSVTGEVGRWVCQGSHIITSHGDLWQLMAPTPTLLLLTVRTPLSFPGAMISRPGKGGVILCCLTCGSRHTVGSPGE